MAFTALRDQNRISIWWGISSTDGVTPTPIEINSATGFVKVELGTSVMPIMAMLPTTIPRDDNRVPCVAGVSSTLSSRFIPVSVNPVTGAIQGQTA